MELAILLGHESLDTTAIYTKAAKETLADTVERSELNPADALLRSQCIVWFLASTTHDAQQRLYDQIAQQLTDA